MSDPRPNPPKPNRRKPGANRLDPIDWHEFANDAVLHGNMSTLFHRPPTEDPSAYASPEALLEIEKRVRAGHTVPPAASGAVPLQPEPPSAVPADGGPTSQPTVGTKPTEDFVPPALPVGLGKNRKVKPIREVYDALTLAGQILYKAMYGPPDGTGPRQCAKGYRQLAAETRLDKDTVRDLIADFKDKGMIREIGSYNPDTRSPKTYEVLPGDTILRRWREAGCFFVTSGRQRPEFCTPQGQPQPPLRF